MFACAGLGIAGQQKANVQVLYLGAVFFYFAGDKDQLGLCHPVGDVHIYGCGGICFKYF